MKTFTRYYKITDITIKVESDLPILNTTFDPKFKFFETNGPGDDNISVHHHFESYPLPETRGWKKTYDNDPWKIYQADNQWLYKRVHMYKGKRHPHCTALFNYSHTRADIYHDPIQKEYYAKGFLDALTLFPTDEIILARILADRMGCFFHSNGVVFKNKGFLFLGHSGYGKSTISKMLETRGGKILCDDRTIVRAGKEGIQMHGNWCHGKEKIFSSDASFLDGIFFITQSDTNEITRSDNTQKNIYRLISFIIKPLVTKQWWDNNFDLIEFIARNIPCYNLRFDKKGEIVDLIDNL